MLRAGIYIHIPFCRSRCSYCDFATGMFESETAERYVRALLKEIDEWNEVAAPVAIETIYFGGGTPSLLSASQIEDVLTAITTRFDQERVAEINLEINPGDGGVRPPARPEARRKWRAPGIQSAS